MNRKIITALTVLLLIVCGVAFAGGYKSQGTDIGSYNDLNSSGLAQPAYDGYTVTLASLGWGNSDGASRTIGIASPATVISASYLAYGFIDVTVSAEAEVGSMADGSRPGQIVTLECTSLTGSGTHTVTPTTKTGFTSFQFTAVHQFITLIWVNSSVGWRIVSNSGCTIA